MVYADYEYYTSTYLGTAINEADFPRLSLRASSYLDYYTQGRAADSPDLDALKMACCALAEQYQAIDTAKRAAQKNLSYAAESDVPEVSSETVGSWSRSYQSGGSSATSAASAMEAYNKTLADIVKQYLAGPGLLYRGGRRCKCQCSHTL